jgi:ribonuclease HII
MLKFERECNAQGLRLVCGIDEAGRGPLAGPVVAACVVFDTEQEYPMANDSKKLSEKQREALYDAVISSCRAWGVGISDCDVIDEINILQATFRAMRQAVAEAEKMLGSPIDAALVDHVHIPDLPSHIKQISITHGDALSVSIGAASIIAKVTRDRMMVKYAEEYPGYGFEKHKGYGTKAHYAAIEAQGISPIHRRTFLKNILEKQ